MTDQERICKNCKHWREKANDIGECAVADEPWLDPLGVAYATDSCHGWELKESEDGKIND